MATSMPYVGATVHYVSEGSPVLGDGTQKYKSACRAATITEVDPDDADRVGLAVVNPTGIFFRSLADSGCELDAGEVGPNHNGDTIIDVSYSRGSWHWPERKPVIGDTVHYVLTDEDAAAVNRRRSHAAANMTGHRETADGSQIHVGSSAFAGAVYPMVVVRVWTGGLINGQILLDGNDTLWATSVEQGGPVEQRCWHWPAA